MTCNIMQRIRCRHCDSPNHRDRFPSSPVCSACNGVLVFVYSDTFKNRLKESFESKNYKDAKYSHLGLTIDMDNYMKGRVKTALQEMMHSVTSTVFHECVRLLYVVFKMQNDVEMVVVVSKTADKSINSGIGFNFNVSWRRDSLFLGGMYNQQ